MSRMKDLLIEESDRILTAGRNLAAFGEEFPVTPEWWSPEKLDHAETVARQALDAIASLRQGMVE